ncbi:SLBB domain-containing protein [Sediminibacterium goheungense]|uniref:Protein involved in polysaccharide export with SLBB domain n=1 Tax=Sediminibacterium goheungense TaxID=1086393 RepID=A0A4R6IW14_9BACT|nr:SLBB domain-containing protein [Sediminibacterium goheungense]TDO26899.1 protein involved in polysaccharide export with SLBB domain [Sediminibacterium goheungense]
MKMHFLLRFTIVVLFFLSTTALQAQDILKGKDLSTIRVDQLSDADIAKLKAQLNESKLTIEQVEQMAMAKGMSATEFTKLKARLNADTKGQKVTGALKSDPKSAAKTIEKQNNSSDSLAVEQFDKKKPQPLINPLIFGSELYTSVSPSFEPNLKLATPLNYVLGPDDELLVTLYGVQEYTGELLVSDEGNINVPNVGQIRVAGLTIEAATQKLKTVMGNSVYPYLKNGGSKLSVTLNKIRSIKVTVIGANRPGNLTVSSLSTIFNALYLAGGPTEFGSFREIELVRNNKPIQKVDLYRMLLKGDQSDNIGLKDNDVIRIPAYKKRVEIQGQVKRPGIFEVLSGESFQDVLEFASGFTDTAYTAIVKAFQNSDRERKVKDIPAAEYQKYQPESGDIFVVSKILNRFQNRVKINGAVFRPDVYELTNGLTVGELIRKADGLKEDAYTGRAQILRLQDDLKRSILSFDVRKALSGDAAHNLLLKREDEILISSVLDLRDSFKVTIQGEVRMPGEYDFVDNLTLRDIILQAGGFTDAAYKSIEIARLIKRDSIAPTDNRASSIINTEIDGDLSIGAASVGIMPYDVITVRRKAGYTLPETVLISGQVQYPGPYALSNRSEKVSDLLKRSGGYTPDAFPAGAYIKRYLTEEEKRKKEATKEIQKNISNKDTATLRDLDESSKKEFVRVPLDLPSIMNNPGSIEDLVLRIYDELVIPKFDGQVKVSGAVLLETQVPYNEKNKFKDYISSAGGYSGDSWVKNSYVVYANGKAATTKRFLFFKSYPKIQPGSEIIVPKRPERRGMTTGEIIGISSALASLAGVVIAILRL